MYIENLHPPNEIKKHDGKINKGYFFQISNKDGVCSMLFCKNITLQFLTIFSKILMLINYAFDSKI